MLNENLIWRIEGVCLKAWPALHEKAIDGWLLRFAHGLTRRSNSANPQHSTLDTSDALIASSESEYGERGLPVYFRIPSIIGPAMPARSSLKLSFFPRSVARFIRCSHSAALVSKSDCVATASPPDAIMPPQQFTPFVPSGITDRPSGNTRPSGPSVSCLGPTRIECPLSLPPIRLWLSSIDEVFHTRAISTCPAIACKSPSSLGLRPGARDGRIRSLAETALIAA
jgi:hypothetical protein